MDELPPNTPSQDSGQNPIDRQSPSPFYPPRWSDPPFQRRQHLRFNSGSHSGSNSGSNPEKAGGSGLNQSEGVSNERPGKLQKGKTRRGKHPDTTDRLNKRRKRHDLGGHSGEHPVRPSRREMPRTMVRTCRRWILMSLYVAVTVEIIAACLTAPALAVRKVEVAGLAGLPEAERTQTLQALTVPRGTNWFLVPLNSLRGRAARLPWVQTASVKLGLISTFTLRATVTPRVPMFTLIVGVDPEDTKPDPTAPSAELFEVDEEGIPIRILREEMRGKLPKIVVPGTNKVVLGRSVATETVKSAIEILHSTERDSTLHISKIVIDQNDNLCLNMLDGMKIELGQSDEIVSKIAQLQKIYTKDSAIGNRLAVINLSNPSAPACTLRLAVAPSAMSVPTNARLGSQPPVSNVTP